MTDQLYEGFWRRSDGYWLWEKGDGRYAANEWLKINGKWFFFNEKGRSVRGWMSFGGSRCFFDENGALVTGRPYQINGDWYIFDKNGHLMRNIELNADGSIKM